MDSQRYRVIVSGELLPGYAAETAVAAMVKIFETSNETLQGLLDGNEHVVGQGLSADDALELQARLDRIGVRCRVERSVELPLRETTASPAGLAAKPPSSTHSEAETASTRAGVMHCPACGFEQQVSERCVSCGIVFSEYNAAVRRSGGRQAPSEPIAPEVPRPATPAASCHPEDWRSGWLDGEEDNEPDERSYLGLFFGEKAELYLEQCDRYLGGARTRLALGWNWGAVFSPFIWALYRKLWGWSAVIFVTEVFVPALLIILGVYDIGSPGLIYLGYLMLLVNRLFWPAVANYLYCRHARITLQRLHMMSPNYAAEIDIATAGGTSTGSVLVGLSVAVVMTLFLWSMVDSVHKSTQQVLPMTLFDLSESRPTAKNPEPSASAEALQRDAQQNQWIQTRSRLRVLGEQVNSWLQDRSGATSVDLNLYRLREDFSLPREMFSDAWKTEVQYIPDTEGYRLISAGPDRLFGTADDMQYRRVLTE